MFGSEPDLKMHVQNYSGFSAPREAQTCLFRGGGGSTAL